MRLLSLAVLAVTIAFSALVTPSKSSAMTCWARHKVCLNVCATQYAKFPGCTRYCGDALPVCLSTGCWKTPQSDKCGYSKG
jgi:hypothetical protein